MAEKEAESDIEKLIKAELNYVVFKKKPIADDYLIYCTGLADEKSLIREYLIQDKVKKYVLTQCLILDACYKNFAEKANFDSNEQKCEMIRFSLDYFLNNIYWHKNKLLSESIKDQIQYSIKEFKDNNILESNFKTNDQQTKINKLQKIGTDIYFLVEKIYPNVKDL